MCHNDTVGGFINKSACESFMDPGTKCLNKKGWSNVAKQTGYMAIDQYGQTHHLGLTQYPRKALMDKFECKHAEKIYTDTPEGTRHTGWIIKGYWLTVYQVIPMERTA